MEKAKINSLREYYELSSKVASGGRGYSSYWCREASEAILELLDEVETLPEYQYALHWTHIPSGTTGRIGGWGADFEGWGSKEDAQTEMLDQKDRDVRGGVGDHYTYKLLKRRIQGEVEDA